MAVDHRNGTAYDLSLFEPARKKKIPKDDRSDKTRKSGSVIKLDTGRYRKAQRKRYSPLAVISVTMVGIAIASVSSIIVYNFGVLNELNEQIQSVSRTIENQNDLEAQYRLKIDSKLTTDIVKNYAENKLGMTPAKNGQKKFVALADGDNGKIIREDSKNSLLDILKNIFNVS